MSSAVESILSDLAAAIRQQVALAEATVGACPTSTATPRASVESDGLTWTAADDAPGVQWGRLRVRITIRSSHPQRDPLRNELEDLTQQARQAVLADPFRGGLCRHLPIGRATEWMQVDPPSGPRHPNAEVAIALRCHFEWPEGQT